MEANPFVPLEPPPSSALAPPVPAGEGEDPELLALPNPPRRERTLTLLVLLATALASLVMALTLTGDVSYALSSKVAVDLGELGDARPDATLENRFVRGHGTLGAGGAIRFERPLTSGSFRLSPVAGRRDLWVEVRVPEGEENGRYLPPSSFAGRLVRFDAAGPRHRGLARAIEDATGQSVPPGAQLLADGEAPAGSWATLALAAMFLAFAAWNGLAMARLLRRVR